MAKCGQCVRVKLAVPEATAHVAGIPGFTLGQVNGTVAEGTADAKGLERLRQHRLVRGVEVLRPPAPREPLEPWSASLGSGVVDLLHQPGVWLIAVLAALLVRVSRPQGSG